MNRNQVKLVRLQVPYASRCRLHRPKFVKIESCLISTPRRHSASTKSPRPCLSAPLETRESAESGLPRKCHLAVSPQWHVPFVRRRPIA
ncbi:hypothetical protein IF2G_02787 [Cordyceps javanica]|nr:hypothetical protein IF2G_02787 [Cordyceps javanica]